MNRRHVVKARAAAAREQPPQLAAARRRKREASSHAAAPTPLAPLVLLLAPLQRIAVALESIEHELRLLYVGADGAARSVGRRTR